MLSESIRVGVFFLELSPAVRWSCSWSLLPPAWSLDLECGVWRAPAGGAGQQCLLCLYALWHAVILCRASTASSLVRRGSGLRWRGVSVKERPAS